MKLSLLLTKEFLKDILLNIIEYSLTNDTNYPRLLMIDTVGKYLQKTKTR